MWSSELADFGHEMRMLLGTQLRSRAAGIEAESEVGGWSMEITGKWEIWSEMLRVNLRRPMK